MIQILFRIAGTRKRVFLFFCSDLDSRLDHFSLRIEHVELRICGAHICDFELFFVRCGHLYFQGISFLSMICAIRPESLRTG